MENRIRNRGVNLKDDEKLRIFLYLEGLLAEEKAAFDGTERELITLNNSMEFIDAWIHYYQERRNQNA